MKRAIARLLTLALAMTLAAGCGAKLADTGAGGATETTGASTRRQAVFFGDWQGQHLIPEARELPASLDRSGLVAALVRELLKGPTDPTLQRTLPASVQLREAKVEGGVAQVDLSEELLAIRGSAAVNQALGSLVLTLTELEGIEAVQVLVEGQRGTVLDESTVLSEPMARPFYGDVPYLANPDRVQYLQELLARDEGQRWRTEPVSVLRFEGRGFGFPSDRLESGYLLVSGDVAQARIPYRGTTYLIELTRNTEVKENGVWTISRITSHRVEAGAIEMPLYFADRQAVNVIPEKRALAEGPYGLATAVVEALLAGPTDPFLVKVFPTGTRLLRPVTVSAEGVAAVDLSGEVLRLSGSAEAGRMVDALVYSLTEVPGVRQVQILIDGQQGRELGNFKFDGPMGREAISEQYYLDQDRVAWLQGWADKGQEATRLDPVQTLMWEGRAFGFDADLLKTAQIDQRADGALATLAYRGRTYVIELGRNPGPTGIWFVKGIAVK